MRSKNWKKLLSKMNFQNDWRSQKYNNKWRRKNVLLRMEFYKFKKKSTIWWKNWRKRVDAKGGAGRWRQIRSFAVLQIVPLLLAGKGSRLAWKYLALIRKTTLFPNFEHSFCCRSFSWSGNKDICSGRKGTLKKNYKFKRKTYCNNLGGPL